MHEFFGRAVVPDTRRPHSMNPQLILVAGTKAQADNWMATNCCDAGLHRDSVIVATSADRLHGLHNMPIVYHGTYHLRSDWRELEQVLIAIQCETRQMSEEEVARMSMLTLMYRAGIPAIREDKDFLKELEHRYPAEYTRRKEALLKEAAEFQAGKYPRRKK